MYMDDIPKEFLLVSDGNLEEIARWMELWGHSLLDNGIETISVFRSNRSNWTDQDRQGHLPGTKIKVEEVNWIEYRNDYGRWWEAAWIREEDDLMIIFKVYDV